MAAEVHLFCLPYAGGSAALYRDWARLLPSWIAPHPLHLPGRGVRMDMAPLHAWPDLIDLLARDAAPYLDRPYAIFGHSMGALVALELAHELWARHGLAPLWIGASACVAPAHREYTEKWLHCSRQAMLAELRALDGTSAELLGNDELMDLMLPTLRADFHLCGTYRRRARGVLPCALSVLAGRRDPALLAHADALAEWSHEISGPFAERQFDAGHFFIDTHRPDVLAHVVESLGQALRRENHAYRLTHDVAPADRFAVSGLCPSIYQEPDRD